MKEEDESEKEEPVRLSESAPALDVEVQSLNVFDDPLREEEERERVNGAYVMELQVVNALVLNTPSTDVRVR